MGYLAINGSGCEEATHPHTDTASTAQWKQQDIISEVGAA
jgi:hypothetical protein